MARYCGGRFRQAGLTDGNLQLTQEPTPLDGRDGGLPRVRAVLELQQPRKYGEDCVPARKVTRAWSGEQEESLRLGDEMFEPISSPLDVEHARLPKCFELL